MAFIQDAVREMFDQLRPFGVPRIRFDMVYGTSGVQPSPYFQPSRM